MSTITKARANDLHKRLTKMEDEYKNDFGLFAPESKVLRIARDALEMLMLTDYDDSQDENRRDGEARAYRQGADASKRAANWKTDTPGT